MRQAAEDDLRPFPLFHSVAAPAEQTGLPGSSFDAVTVAQAFHWFDHLAARREFRRLLRPGGWALIVRNDRRTDTSPFARDYEELLKGLGEPYEAAVHRDEAAGTRRLREFFGARGTAGRGVRQPPLPGLARPAGALSFVLVRPGPGRPRT